MKRILKILAFLPLVIFANNFTALPQITEYTEPFFEKYPEYDGTGVTIFIMDTGIEATIPGLDKMPDGTVKIIDVYDASQTGDVSVQKIKRLTENDTKYLTNKDDVYLQDYQQFDLPLAETYIGAFREELFKNADIHDVNDNGSTDDVWGFIIFPDENDNWFMIMDTNLDGSLNDEILIRDYHINFDLIQFPLRNPKGDHQWISLAINIYPKRKIINFHFEDGGHGTHVAGIAAGYHLNGDEAVNGLAPGANLISVKIGAGSLPGNATTSGSKKRGFEYIEKYMQDHPGPAVINMSYGIASSSEGFSDIDNVVNDFCVNNPGVVFCSSAGNSGPGISSIGSPAAAQFAISSGALMYPTTGRDQYGYVFTDPKIIHFSSRGGEANKPDIVSPGAMLSTVTQWSDSDFWWGTSMASPYTAGAIASILSGVQIEYPDKEISSALILEGIRQTAKSLPDYSKLDQGAGMLDMLGLFNWLKKEMLKPAPLLSQISTETYNPSLPKEKSNSIFWKIYDVKDIPEDIDVKIKAEFSTEISRSKIDENFSKYKISSDSRWIKPAQKSLTLLRDINADIILRLKTDKFTENSINTATIRLEPENYRQSIGQEFYATVINPLHFDHSNEYSYSVINQSLDIGATERYFLAIPIGATGLHFELSSEKNDYAFIRTYIHNNNGLRLKRCDDLDTDDEVFEIEQWMTDELTTGIWEVVLYGDLAGKKTSRYNMDISFSGIEFDPDTMKTLEFVNGEKPQISGTLTPSLMSYRDVTLKGAIEGYACKTSVKFGESDTVSIPLKSNSYDAALGFRFNIPQDKHILFTDLAALIEDENGEYVRTEGFDFGRDELLIKRRPAGNNYTLKLIFAYTYDNQPEEFEISVEEIHYFKTKLHGKYEFPKDRIYRGIIYPYTLSFEDTPEIIPDNFYYYGNVNIENLKGEILSEKTVRLK